MIITAAPGRNSTVRRLARARELLHHALKFYTDVIGFKLSNLIQIYQAPQ